MSCRDCIHFRWPTTAVEVTSLRSEEPEFLQREDRDSKTGKCKRYPPQMFAVERPVGDDFVGTYHTAESVYPTVSVDDACGEERTVND